MFEPLLANVQQATCQLAVGSGRPARRSHHRSHPPPRARPAPHRAQVLHVPRCESCTARDECRCHRGGSLVCV